MSQENVEIVRRCIEVNRSGDLEATSRALISLADPEIEFVSALTGLEGGSYRGHEGVREYMQDLAASWSEWRNELGAIDEVTPHTFVVEYIFRGIGRGSGVPVERPNVTVFELSNRKVVRIHVHRSRAEALKAARVSE